MCYKDFPALPEFCVAGPPATITVPSPCASAELVAIGSLPDPLIVTSQLVPKSADLSSFLSTLETSVDELGLVGVPPDVCGDFTFQVLERDDNGAILPNLRDSVTYDTDANIVTYTPALGEAGGVSLVLRLSLANWSAAFGGDGFTDVDFTVRATACEAMIDASGAVADDYDLAWGSNRLGISLAGVLDAYVQTPGCGYDFDFQIKRLGSGAGSQVVLTDAPELVFHPGTKTIDLDKCSSGNNSNGNLDAECLTGTPYEKVMTFVVYAVLRDGTGNVAVDTSVQF